MAKIVYNPSINPNSHVKILFTDNNGIYAIVDALEYVLDDPPFNYDGEPMSFIGIVKNDVKSGMYENPKLIKSDR